MNINEDDRLFVMFPRYKQERVKALLIRNGISREDLERAMCSRLRDLEEIISWEERQELIR